MATAVTERWRQVALSWREARPVVQVMFQVRFLTGAALGAPQATAVRPSDLVLGAAAWLCAVWHVYLVNGLCDQVEDRGNGSDRPLATGRLPVRPAWQIAVCLAAAAVLLGVAVSPRLTFLVVLLLGLGCCYSAGRRPQKGNVLGFFVVVGGGGVVTYLAGCEAAGGMVDPNLMLLMVAMSLWMALAGTTKDLSDVSGDRAAGRRTLPVVLGDRDARRLMAALAVSVGGFLVAGAMLAAPALLPAALVLLAGAVAVAACTLLLTGVTGRRRQRRPYRLFMVSQYAVHLTVLHQCLR
nr:UbiA family prenyltransferase [Micromonospora sp. DSM 115978]